MDIVTVKKMDTGYLVNGEIFVPEAPGNRDYVAVLEWIDAGNVPEDDTAKTDRTAEIYNRLAEIDALRIRPLSELMLNPESDYARGKLSALETEAAALRAELAGI